MSKMLPATCTAQVVTVLPIVPIWQPALPAPPNLPVPATPLVGAVVLSAGIGPSVGVAILDEDKAVYIANIAPDLAALLSQVLTALGQVKAAIQAIATGPVTPAGGSAGPTSPALAASLATNVTALTAVETALTTLQGVLK